MVYGKEDEAYGIIRPSCNVQTVLDGRGGIFTWLPREDIREINLHYLSPGLGKKESGVHPDATEYRLIVSGSGVMVCEDSSGKQEVFHMSRGDCAYVKPGISHAFHAITDSLSIVMRSKTLNEHPTKLKEAEMFGRVYPHCNLDTVIDKRRGLFTWIPEQSLKEFNLLYFKPGESRGDHFHPEFTEHFLIVDGSGKMVYKDPSSPQGQETVYHMSIGDYVCTKPGMAHAFHAINPLIAVALLSKPWDECKEPIIRANVSRFLEGEHD